MPYGFINSFPSPRSMATRPVQYPRLAAGTSKASDSTPFRNGGAGAGATQYPPSRRYSTIRPGMLTPVVSMLFLNSIV